MEKYSIFPYRKDLHRPTMKERDEAAKAREEGNQNGGNGTDLNGSRLHPIFEIPNARASPKKTTPEAERRHKVSVLKGKDSSTVIRPKTAINPIFLNYFNFLGTDGISRNVFNTRDLEDDEDRNPLPVPKAVSMPMSTVPQKGFLGDLSFTFELPKDRFGTCNGAKSSVNTSFEQQDSSDNDESDTTESTSGKVSSVVSRVTVFSLILDIFSLACRLAPVLSQMNRNKRLPRRKKSQKWSSPAPRKTQSRPGTVQNVLSRIR